MEKKIVNDTFNKQFSILHSNKDKLLNYVNLLKRKLTKKEQYEFIKLKENIDKINLVMESLLINLKKKSLVFLDMNDVQEIMEDEAADELIKKFLPLIIYYNFNK